ncbi:MAG: sensor histidine kinase [Sphingobacteriales bacterium]|nr:MAG: sensor histidine kinase [Sphingobacteriales bacterium]
MDSNSKILKWRFDVSTFRLLGQQLISDRITALFELVKNCYDANAQEVHIEFYNVGSLSENSKIIIRDDGVGMTLEDVQNKWMVIGTNSKRTQLYADDTRQRRVIGEKGIGRFAVDKLGSRLLMQTKTANDTKELKVVIQWSDYEDLSQKNAPTLFTDIENLYEQTDSQIGKKGTTLTIEGVREIWTDKDITISCQRFSKLISPFTEIKPPFRIFVSSNEYKNADGKLLFDKTPIKNDTVDFATESISLEYDKMENSQQVIKNKKGKLVVETQKIDSVLGGVNFKLFYFDENGKGRFKKANADMDNKIDGIRIYRDGLLATPFVEYEDNRDKQRDILGIDKRRWSGFFERVSSRDLMGFVDISKDENPHIIESTNRQDFLDNEAYRNLKTFIIAQIIELEKALKDRKLEKREKVSQELNKANEDLKEFTKTIREIKKDNPLIGNYLEPLEKQAKQAEIAIKKGIKDKEEQQKEFVRKENIYLSMMSLQQYAMHLAHALRIGIGRIKRPAEFLSRNFPNPLYEERFKKYAENIFNETNTLSRILDFMLSYAKSDLPIETFSVKNLLQNLFHFTYHPLFELENIQANVEMEEDLLLNSNPKFFEDIFEQLISNSIKALENQSHKVIRCTGLIENNQFVLYFSDNGYGIKQGDEENIFEIYYTQTAHQGGSGIGLYIVKTRIEALRGTIQVVENEFKPTGATFKISLPLNKK